MGVALLWPQTEVPPATPGGKVLLQPADAAVLAATDARRDLPCVLTHWAPELGFDSQFHSGYSVRVPLRELAGGGDVLRILMRVSSHERPDATVYLSDRFPVPPIGEGASGEATLPGSFVVDSGRSRVDWLMRDRAGRVCSAHWELKTPKAPPARREPGRQLRVKILLHFAPQRSGEADVLLAMLRGIAREPGIGRFSLTVFHAARRRVLFRRDDAPAIDFPALDEALDGFEPLLVDYRQLQENNGEGRFLADLLEGTEADDAVIFVGPKLGTDPRSPAALPAPRRPVFYLSYTYDPLANDPLSNPGRDAVAVLVKALHGRVYTISRPDEMAAAWRDLLRRLSPPPAYTAERSPGQTASGTR